MTVSLNASVASGAINVRFYDGKKAYISNNLQAGESGIITATGQVAADTTQLSVVILNQTENTTFTPIAIKLELGSISTIQNDPPQDYGVELAKCQRYFYETNPGGNANANVGNGCSTTATTCAIWINLPVKMRLNQPTVTYMGNWNLKTSSNDLHVVTNMTVMVSNNSANRCIAYCTSSGLTVGKTYYLEAADDVAARLSLSAEL